MSQDQKQEQRQQQAEAPSGGRVNVDAAEGASYWCRRLRCTEAALRSALNSVGPVAEDVERHLNSARKR